MVFVLAGCGTAALLGDGRVLLRSGVTKIYDPATGRVTNATEPSTTRLFETATALQDGRVLIVGGTSSLGDMGLGGLGGLFGASPEPSPTPFVDPTLASAEIYDGATDTYTPTGSMAHPRAFHSATLLSDGRVLVVGGGKSNTNGSSATTTLTPEDLPPPEIWDPATGTFSPTNGNTIDPHAWHTATLLQDGRVLIAGGVTATASDGASPAPDGSSSGAATAAAELFDPATGTFTATGSMTTPRVWGTATRLADGRVLFVGGVKNTSSSTSTDSSGATDTTPTTAEIYDPASGTFSATGAPAAGRVWHTANLLPDGHVLIAGGFNMDQATASTQPFLTSAELFDPASGTFAPTGAMVDGQALHTGTTLQDGKVLLAGLGATAIQALAGSSSGSGGSSGDLLTTAQIYDPASGTFSAVQVEPAPQPSASPAG
jgi:hypothetical protein